MCNKGFMSSFLSVVCVSLFSAVCFSGTVLLDFGLTEAGSGWNTISNVNTGTMVSGLVTDTGVQTGATYYCSNGFNQAGFNGVSGTIYPDSAGTDYFAVTQSDTARIEIQDLLVGQTYNFTFFSSRNASGPRQIDITIGGVTQMLEAAYNASNLVTFSGISPDGLGVVAIDFGTTSGSSFGYLNVLEITGTFDVPAPQAFVESGGLVCMEAEHYNTAESRSDAPTNWVVETSTGGYVGDGYAVVPDDTIADVGAYTASCRLTYLVDIQTLGTYTVYARRHAYDGGDNSAYTGLEGVKLSGNDNEGYYNQWFWADFGTIEVTALGVQTFDLVRREDGYKVDRIVLTTGAAPTGNGPSESAKIDAPPHVPTDYYVANDGSDINPGTLVEPFATIQHAANLAKAGDTVYIRSGVYRETVTPGRAGQESAPITFQAYNGEQVILSGCDPITGWSIHSGNIWKATVDWSMRDGLGDTVFVNGQLKFEGRYPNTTDPMDRSTWGAMSSIDPDKGAWMTANSLKGFGDDYWNGYMIRNHFTNWTLKDMVIDDYESSAGKVIYETAYGAAPQYFGGTRSYYVYGGLKVLDAEGEWYKDVAGNTLYYVSSVDPDTIDIEFKRRPYLFNLDSKDHIHIRGIEFRGGGIDTNSATDYNIYENNVFVGFDRGSTGWGRWGISGTGNILKSNEIKQHWVGVGCGGVGNQVVNNYFHESGYYGGNNGALNISGAEHLIAYNTFRNIGRNVSQGAYARCDIKYNLFEDCGNLTTDTGAIEWNDMGGTVFHHNLFRNNSDAAFPFSAFYGGGNPDNAVFHHNVMYNCGGNPHHAAGSAGFVLHVNNTYIDGNCRLSGGGMLHTSKFLNNVHLDYAAFKTDLYEVKGNHLYEDSDFVNAAGRDYRLAAGSGAIDRGVIVPGITETFNGNAPDAGAIEYGESMFDVGHDFDNPPNPVYAWQQVPGMNLVPDAGIDSFTGWSVTGNPTRVTTNTWNLGFDALGRNGSHSLVMSDGDQISQVFGDLTPDTWYKVASRARIVGDVIQVETYDAASRGDIEIDSERGETGISNMNDGDWVCFENIDFGSTVPYYDRIELLYSFGIVNHFVEVRVDNPITGQLLGTMQFDIVKATTWKTAGAAVNPGSLTGVHDLYLIFVGDGAPEGIYDELRFIDGTYDPAEQPVIGARNFGSSEIGNGVMTRFGDSTWQNDDFQEVPEIFYFKTGPSSTSAEIYFEGGNGVLEGYLDSLFLYESPPKGNVVSSTGMAIQSTTSGANDASNAIDGLVLGSNPSETLDIANSWWQVDLGSKKDIYEILLTVPQTNPGRLSNFRVSVWSSDPATGGVELWGQDYLSSGTLNAGETFFVKYNDFSDDYETKLGDVKGRFVRVQLNGINNAGSGILSIGEVQVIEFDYTNKAMTHGDTEQSSTYGTGYAWLATDGDTNPDYSAGSVTHTQDQPNSWWQVGFIRPITLGKIVITNREGSVANRLSNFEVSLWDGNPNDGGIKLWSKDYYQTGSVSSGGQLVIQGGDLDDATGYIRLASVGPTYVRIQLNGTNNAGNGILSLAEVQVYTASDVPPLDNVAQGGNARQSSRNGYGNEQAPVDGDVYANYIGGGSTNRTDGQDWPWWQAELRQEVSNIEQITFVPRSDSGGISNYRISLWDGNPEHGSNELWGQTYPSPRNVTQYLNAWEQSDSGTRINEVVGARFVRLEIPNKTASIIFSEMQVWRKNEKPRTPDMSGNGKVDFKDFALFAACWQDPFCTDADFIGADTVDLEDLLYLSENWLMSFGSGIFQESGGQVCMEAEHFTVAELRDDVPNGWITDNSIGDYVGSGYVIFPEDTPPNNNTGVYETSGRLTYAIDFTTTGTYTIYVRRYSVDSGENSAFAGLDGGISTVIDNQGDYNQWIWKSLGTVNVSSSGTKIFDIVRREHSYKIDRMVLTKGAVPIGYGPAESVRAD